VLTFTPLSLVSSAVSNTSSQGSLSFGTGSTKGIVLAWSALNRISMVSAEIASPCSSTSIWPPKSCTPRQRT